MNYNQLNKKNENEFLRECINNCSFGTDLIKFPGQIDFKNLDAQKWFQTFHSEACKQIKNIDWKDKSKQKRGLKKLCKIANNVQIESGYLLTSAFFDIIIDREKIVTKYVDGKEMDDFSTNPYDLDYKISPDEILKALKETKTENVIYSVTTYNADQAPECSKCKGEGYFTCEKCKGKGSIKCKKCKGEGSFKCEKCNGQGYFICKKCKGRGFAICEKCDEQGFIECKNCRGRGFTRCRYCGGDGRRSYTDGYFANGEPRIKTQPCTYCNGTGGLSQCTDCLGTGKLQCWIVSWEGCHNAQQAVWQDSGINPLEMNRVLES